GATLYATHSPCITCAKMLINAGIKRIVTKKPYPDTFAKKIFAEAEIKVEVVR
ncbi:MAG: cytidine deaminase, partial [Candidatus Latescibacteria bacterium]|nr:cytidine deaminase [Candidatus Latescibacterota bacterium]